MPTWKLNIFVSAVKIRYEAVEGTYEDILSTYTKLTAAEKAEILMALTAA